MIELSEVVNAQRKVKLDLVPIRAFVADLPEAISEIGSKRFSVAFVPDDRMRQLNEMFRGKNSTTDVLSFPHGPDDFVQNASSSLSAERDESRTLNETFLGDIVISAEQAQKQAEENSLTLEAEIKQLILHGLLHLCGYDHEADNGEMNVRELELREMLKI